MDIDTVFAAATAQVAQEQKATEVAPAKTEESPKQETVEEPKAVLPDAELTPEQLAKREANRKSHQDSREARTRRELREVKAQIAQLTQPAQPKPEVTKPDLPKMEDYDSLDTWVVATADKLAEQKIADQNKPKELNTDLQKFASRGDILASKEQELASKLPDYETLIYGDHADLMANMSKPLALALLEADDASLALYALAKEGRLYDLEDMPPQRMAIEIGRAEERGKAYLSTPKATNAPAPMSPLRGSRAGGSPLEKQSPDALLEWLKT